MQLTTTRMQAKGRHGRPRIRSARTSRANTPKSHSTSRCYAAHLNSTNSLLRSTRLAEILRHRAALLEHIITDQRYYSDYFRVAFYGTFPDAIRNKQFIVRTLLSFI